MVALSLPLRKLHSRLLLLIGALWLAACEPIALGGGGPSINTSAPVPVALLVPRTSADGGAVLAASLENAARLAMADLDGVAVDLRVYDTAGSPDGAAVAARAAANEGAKILVGPVFASSANAAGAAVPNINILSFSNNPAVAGGNVFILGQTFQSAANRLASYAAAQGKGNILIAHGNDAGETQGADAIRRAIAGSGASLAGSTSFELSQTGVVNALPGIAAQARSSGATAIFFTSGTDGALPFLVDLLPENGIDPATTQFIGLRRLDVPSSALSLRGLQGSWFAAPDQSTSNGFSSRYTAAYGNPPHPLAGLAYDAVAAIGALAATGDRQALTAASLTRAQGFIGANGIFRFLPNGTNERGLAVAAVQNNGVVVLDPAPRSFGAAGF